MKILGVLMIYVAFVGFFTFLECTFLKKDLISALKVSALKVALFMTFVVFTAVGMFLIFN